MVALDVLRAIRARRDFAVGPGTHDEWNRRGSFLAANRLDDDGEYEGTLCIERGRLTAFVTVCTCGEAHATAYWQLPDGRLWANWWRGDGIRRGRDHIIAAK